MPYRGRNQEQGKMNSTSVRDYQTFKHRLDLSIHEKKYLRIKLEPMI